MNPTILEFLGKCFGQVRDFWTGLSPRRRIVLVGSAILIFGGIHAFRQHMADRAYRPLYTQLTEEEAGAAVEKLKDLQVPYRLAAGGTTILVPEPHVAEVRIQLASDGLPRYGRLGFELFDENSFGATEFAEHVNFRRALEGELERSIISLSEVERARVHISLPRQSVFLEDERPAKASVILHLRRGSSLSEEQVTAVSFLVASAVEDLDPRKVVIVDTSGRVLARPGPDGDGFSGEQLEYRRKLEKEINRRVTATLEPYVGFDRVRSNTVAEVDWNQGEQTEEVLDPNTVVMTTQRSEENTRPLQQKGVPGTASNLPRAPEAPETTANSASRILETTNFQTSRTVTRLELQRGEIKRLSVAVLVDHRIEVDEQARDLIRVARTPEEMEKFRRLVIAAAGIIEQRGDILTIENLPFTIFEEPPEPPPPPPNPEDELFSLEWVNKYRYHLIAVGVSLVLLTFTVWFAMRIRHRVARMRAEAEAKRQAEEERKQLEATEDEARKHAAEEAKMLQGLRLATLQSSKAQVLKKHLEEMAANESEAFVQLMRSWIHEDDK